MKTMPRSFALIVALASAIASLPAGAHAKQYSAQELTDRTVQRRAIEAANWILTREGKPFFVMFRIYGPQKGAVDGSWILNNVEEVN